MLRATFFTINNWFLTVNSFVNCLTTNAAILSCDGSIIVAQSFVLPRKSHKSSNFNYKPFKLVAMRHPILLLAISALAFGSCTTAYKTGQTPDDVYYSPTRTVAEYVSTDNNDDNSYQSPDQYSEDRYLRMRIHNRYRWYDNDDAFFYQNNYNYSYYNNWNSWNNPWNPYTSWNYFYNPYCTHVVVGNSHGMAYYNRPRTFNLATYNTPVRAGYTSPSSSMYTNHTTTNRPVRIFNANNSSSNNRNSNSSSTGEFLRNVFNSNSSSSNNSNSSSNNNSSSSSSSSGSSSSGSSTAPVRRF